MKNDSLRRLPPPPLFTIRPPPKPPGSLFENFRTVEILNGQCVRQSLNILNKSSSTTIFEKHEEQLSWLNIFLLILAIISVISCIIIAIFIFICLKKLKKEENEYKNYVITGSLSSRSHQHHQSRHHHHHQQSDYCTRTSEHYKCTSNKLNCCDDYYSHQLIPMTEAPLSSVISSDHIVNSSNNFDLPSTVNNTTHSVDNSQNHQYECIPEYLLTMTRHRHPHPPSIGCHRQHQIYHRPSTCSVPYATFSRSLLQSRGATTKTTTTASISDSSQCTCSPPTSATAIQEESSTPLLASSIYKESHRTGEILMSSPKSMIIGWTRRNPSTSTKRKSMNINGNEQRHSFLSQLRKSSLLQ